jgi:2'-5' RNA ligase
VNVSATESALIVSVPDAEPVVGLLRSRLDSSAPLGVPAHITVLYPFMPPELIDPGVVSELGSVFAKVDRFDLELTSVGWFETDVVYLAPEPQEVFKALTAMVFERWPDWPPYGGLHPDPTPHLTVGDNEDYASMVEAASAVEPFLPVRTTVTEIELIAGNATPGSWKRIAAFPLRVVG